MAPQKKTLSSSERDEEERATFRRRARGIEPNLFVWVDECGTHTSMARRYARAPKGERAYGSVPRNRGKNTTLIASMTLEGAMGEAVAFEGSTKAFVFEAYVERFLAPTLRPGQIVVMDNLSAHKTDRVRQLIEARGAELWFLPAYSPDLNPIEEAFSKIKALLKKAAARTREALVKAMGEALLAVTPRDAAGWFAHCGYEGQPS
jgi:transposase